MRVLAFVYSFPPFRGGSGMGMYDLLKRLAECDDYRITVVTFNYDGSGVPEIETLDGMQVFRLSCWRVAHIYPLPKPTLRNWVLLKESCDGDYDIVYTRTRFFFSTLLGLCVSWWKRLPMLHTEPGSGYVGHDKWWATLIARIWDWTIGRVVARRATCVGVSKASSEFIKGLGAKSAVTIYNGVDHSIFYPASHPVQNNPVRVLYAGRLEWTKGIDILNDVALQPDGKVHISVAGDGEYPTGDKVECLGHLTPEQLADEMRKSDIFLLPSRMEGLSRVVQEAMACGLPVVATDVGGNRELVEQDVTGRIADLDAVSLYRAIQSLGNSTLRQDMGKQAVRRAKDFDWNKTVKAYKNLMEEITK